MADEKPMDPNVGGEKAAAAPSSSSSLDPKLAGLLAWLLAPITSIIFMVMDDMKNDDFIQFHAKQSLYWVGVEIALWIVLSLLSAVSFGILACLFVVLPFLEIGVRIYGAVKAYNGEKVKLPLIGDWAEK